MPVLDVSGAMFHYLEHKAEEIVYPPLVLIHGAGGSRLDWPRALQQLSGAHMLTVDLPGHGQSEGPGRKDVLAYAEIICEFLDTVNISRAIFAGHSMGGAIAQQIAITMPTRASGLILVGTGSKLPVEPTLPQRIVDEHAAAVNWLTDWSWGKDVADDVKTQGRQRSLDVPAEVLQGDYLACQAFDARPYLEQIAAPTLVLGSQDDCMMKLKFSITLAERIPHAQLVVFEGAGHNFPLERSEQVTTAIREWLAEQNQNNSFLPPEE